MHKREGSGNSNTDIRTGLKDMETVSYQTNLGSSSPPILSPNVSNNGSNSTTTATEEIDFGTTLKTFVSKKLQRAHSFIKKPKPHTCKVTVVMEDGTSLQLMISDGTFMNEVNHKKGNRYISCG